MARKGSREGGTGLTASDVRKLARLAASYPGEPEEGLRRGVLALPGTPHAIDRRGRILRRETIPGSEIDLGPPVAGKAASSAARRLGRALALVDAAWPEAGREIRARTRLVLTPEEQGLVSYSHLHRPGVSYIRLRGKSILDLADDLLHETAHHRLHDLEERTPLFASVPSGGEEVRYYSPWRRALRPVRGIYHAAYTFSFRAELFRRILSRARDAEGRVGPLRLRPEKLRWIEQEARNERRQVLRALGHLGDAARRGFLTARGRRMLATIREAASARAAA